MKSRRLLFVSHSHKLEGGAEFSLLASVRACVNKGDKCLVILPKEGSFADKLDSLGLGYKIQSYTWSAMSSDDSEDHLNLGISHFNADSIIAAYNTLIEFKPEVVITNTIMPPWYAYAAHSIDIPNIMMIRESFDKRNSTRLLPTAEDYLDNLDRVMNHILYNSRYTKDMYKDYLTTPKSSVYYPVVDTDGTLGELIESDKSPLQDNQVRIITPGSISSHKNQLDTLKAVKELHDRGYDNVHLSLMGHVASQDYLETIEEYVDQHKLQDFVHILPFSENPFEEIATNHIIAVPSKSEAFGRVTLEGQLLGRLVIGCAAGGTQEIIDDNKTGLLYNPDSVEDLADKIEWAIHNPDASKEIAKQAQQSAKKNFLSAKKFDPLFEAIEDTINSHDANPARIPFYDPIYALIQRNLHVDQILNEYARSLEEASRKIAELSSTADSVRPSDKILRRAKNITKKIINKN